jgi:uncharacterized protein (TIGR02646 family)
MIPVPPKAEPADFDRKVRKPGQKWLRDNNIVPGAPPPDASKLPPYWRETQKTLWNAYDRVCAYLCIYFDWPLGAGSTDHFVAKSKDAGQAYEWTNYRLSCLGMNRQKNRFDDILDPFQIQHETFVLNLVSGEIGLGPRLSPTLVAQAEDTIKRLKLDDPETNDMRAKHFADYLSEQVTESYLARHSPFVWYEARRQGLL